VDFPEKSPGNSISGPAIMRESITWQGCIAIAGVIDSISNCCYGGGTTKTVVLEVSSLTETFVEALRTMKRVRAEHTARIGFATPGGQIEFPYETVKAEFMLQAA
jgi:hypothetical protein